ncbi:hypothetical protein GCM10027168_47370 [Streptomyces capparidis]
MYAVEPRAQVVVPHRVVRVRQAVRPSSSTSSLGAQHDLTGPCTGPRRPGRRQAVYDRIGPWHGGPGSSRG